MRSCLPREESVTKTSLSRRDLYNSIYNNPKSIKSLLPPTPIPKVPRKRYSAPFAHISLRVVSKVFYPTLFFFSFSLEFNESRWQR
jgi:hypothetical protein